MKLILPLLMAGSCILTADLDQAQAESTPQERLHRAEVESAADSTLIMASAQDAPPSPESQERGSEPDAPRDQPQEPETKADAQDPDTGGVLDPEEEARRLEAAERLLDGMLEAYQSAPALIDMVNAQQWFGSKLVSEETLLVRLGPGKDAELKTKQLQIVAAGDSFYATRAGSGRYMKAPLQEDLLETCRSLFGAQPGVAAHLRFRYAKPRPLLLHSLTLGSLGEEVRISSYRRITDNEGRELEQLTLLAAMGSAVVNVDPETKFIETLEVDYVPAEAPVANLHVRQHLDFNPEVHEELPTPIAFDSEGMLEVRTWRQVLGTEPLDQALVIEEGKAPPDFTLYTLEGRKVVLSELKGKPVLLYFWSVNDVQSRQNIAAIGPFVEWLASSDQPVIFYPIATLARMPEEERWERALETWENSGASTESLIDLRHEVAEAWGLTAANVLVAIDSEGRVDEVKLDLGHETAVEALQELTKSLATASNEEEARAADGG